MAVSPRLFPKSSKPGLVAPFRATGASSVSESGFLADRPSSFKALEYERPGTLAAGTLHRDSHCTA
jgi:hypothetical protein